MHRKYTQNQFFVLNVAFLHQSFETFPVFGSILEVEEISTLSFFYFRTGQLTVQSIFGCSLTLRSQTGVQVNRTVGRSISRNAGTSEFFVFSSLYFCDEIVQSLHFSFGQFGVANIGLLNQEEDFCSS